MIGGRKLFLRLTDSLADRLNIDGMVNDGTERITLHEADGIFEASNYAFEVFIVHGRRAFFNGAVNLVDKKKRPGVEPGPFQTER